MKRALGTAALAAAVVACSGPQRPPERAAELDIQKMPPDAGAPVVAPAPKRAPGPRGTCGTLAVGSPPPPLVNAHLTPGNVTIVYFWATWCAPCQRDFPKYQHLYERLHDRGLDIIAISVDDEDDGAIPSFAKRYKAQFDVLWDKNKSDTQCWQPAMMPTSAIIDRDGIAQAVHNGAQPGDEVTIAEEVESLL